MDVPMRSIIKDTEWNFLGQGRKALMGSGIVCLVCLLSLALLGLNLGLDFTGGTLIEVAYPKAVELADVRGALAEAGFDDAITQHFGTSSEVLIRVAPREGMNSATISSEILRVLEAGQSGVEMRRVEFVGPQVGDELMEDGGLAMLYALIGIMLYVTLRFEWRLALGTIAAIVHDVIITLGIFSLFRVDFDLTVLAAVLAVIGYSVNDSVVVLDRIRENFRRIRRGDAMKIMNISINQTLSRTLMTSLTTLLAVVVLFLLGGPAIRSFSLALIIGVLVGTYSSVYIASATALELGVSREDLLPKAKEEVDERP